MAPLYDIIVYGATGFTGRLCVRYLLSCSAASATRLAVAGRSEKKLKEVLQELGAPDIPIVIADSHDEEALTRMVKQTKAVITTVGPYVLYGSTLVKVCSKEGVHCVDLTGEPLWSYEMKRLYDSDAKSSHAILIHGAGFDSVPSDLNTLLAVKKLQTVTDKPCGEVLSAFRLKGGFSGGTLATGFTMMEETQDPKKWALLQNPYMLSPSEFRFDLLGNVRQGRMFMSLPTVQGKQEAKQQWIFRNGKEIGGTFVMESSNAPVVRQTWGILEEQAQVQSGSFSYGPSFTYREFAATPSYWTAMLTSVVIYITNTVFGSSKILRNFASKYVTQPGQGPSEKAMQEGWFKTTTTARTVDRTHAVQSTMKGRGDPGYLATSVMISETALALVHDYDRLTPIAKQGGHLTTATVFGEDVLKERLVNSGYFEFESKVLQ